ncbi:MAG TPA: glycosyltransferase family 87 protein [Gemmatimonadales bacterium]|nr:glycosyltransferase family 87 protein [Gemmatimonadales bacterium]
MTRLTPRERRALLLAGVLYAAVAIPVGIRRGGDLEVHFTAARLWLEGLPLYAHPPRVGAWWPPLAVLLVVPFAVVAQWSAALAKAAWVGGSMLCLGGSIVRLPRDHWKPVALAVAAVAVPLHRNFEDLNLNAVLLLLLILAAGELARGREGRAGMWIGVAAALKVFPAVWLLYLGYRGRWRGLVIGVAVAAALTIAPLLRYGVGGADVAARDWLGNSAAVAWTPLGSNQSLAALAVRLHVAGWGVAALDLACVALALVALRRPKITEATFEGLGVVGLIAVLVSPIAWVHYFLFAFPVWLITLRLPRQRWGRGWTVALWVAGFATSGIATVWSVPLRDALFEFAPYTWGTLLLLCVVAFAPRSPVQALAGHPASDIT